MYFLQTTDIDLNGNNGSIWTPIGKNTSAPYSGNYNGGNHEIINISNAPSGGLFGLFSKVNSGTYYNVKSCTIENIKAHFYGELNFDNEPKSSGSGKVVGGLITSMGKGVIKNCSVDNLNISSQGACQLNAVGGLVGETILYHSVDIIDCTVTNFSIVVDGFSAECNIGGVVGIMRSNTASNLTVKNATIRIGKTTGDKFVGGAIGKWESDGATASNICVEDSTIVSTHYTGRIGGCIGEIINSSTSDTSPSTITQCYSNSMIESIIEDQNHASIIGGIIGNIEDGRFIFSENQFDGNINANKGHVGGLLGDIVLTFSTNESIELKNNLFQGIVQLQGYVSTSYDCVGGIFGYSYEEGYEPYYETYNNIVNGVVYSIEPSLLYSIGNAETVCQYSERNFINSTKVDTYQGIGTVKTDSEIKDRASYNNWIDFDTYWTIDSMLNNGYPILRAHLNKAKITAFDGSGAEADPYQIKTTADLQGMQSYYNEYDMIDEYYWILMNDIEISVDANNIAINWTPIGYEGGVAIGFNGHFDGNGKTISGLTITEQYENVGLFGRMASTATITNLNVSGTISWDQATNVGGVVGLMEDGAKVTNCSFTGTIFGYLNSGNYATVGGLAGAYSPDAIIGSANYDAYIYGANNYATFTRYTTTYSA